MKTTWIFYPNKLHRKKGMRATWIFLPLKSNNKRIGKSTMIFLPVKLHRKSMNKQPAFFEHQSHAKKVPGNYSDFWTTEITLK